MIQGDHNRDCIFRGTFFTETLPCCLLSPENLLKGLLSGEKLQGRLVMGEEKKHDKQ